ncbi:DUF6188 family protein [Streptomyces niveus]|uniref:DUF6188 family protein n=1 Tax=Streptomyces niveus TaxID=193462 RepID=UPI0036BCDFE7
MQLNLAGQTVSRVCFDYGLVIMTGSDSELRIETAAKIGEAGQAATEFAPDAPGPVAAQLVQLLRTEISQAEVSSSGALVVIFSGGVELLVAPDSDYEAWQVVGPKERVICMPGGELAAWRGE